MYQTSQCYSAPQSGGGLEYIASSGSGYSMSSGFSGGYSASAGGNIAYSAQSVPQQSYHITAAPSTTPSNDIGYAGAVNYKQDDLFYSITNVKPEYHFVPDNFLKPGKGGKFVGQADEIKGFVEETFEKIFNQPFPNDIKVSVLDRERFRKLAPHPSTVGLSINRRKHGLLSEIFVLNNSLGRVMLTLGHELGHVLTETLDNQHDEEAKAYAFSLEWMKVIRENNIGDLGGAILVERPALNGLHNVAFSFVERLVQAGKKVWDVYLELVGRMVKVPTVSPQH